MRTVELPRRLQFFLPARAASGSMRTMDANGHQLLGLQSEQLLLSLEPNVGLHDVQVAVFQDL